MLNWKRTESWNLRSLANDCVPIFFWESSKNAAVNFHKSNKERDLIVLKRSLKIIPNSIIYFIGANQRHFDGDANTESRNRIVSKLFRALSCFVLLLNQFYLEVIKAMEENTMLKSTKDANKFGVALFKSADWIK